MKEKIQKILQGPPESEPIYQLESEYKNLSDDVQKKEFFSVIKSFAIEGNDKEKFTSLTTIEFLGKAKECEEIIKRNTELVVFKENENLISPLLTLCAVLDENWAIDFIQKVIKYFKPKSNEYSYHYDIGLRSIVSTPYWKEVINEIKWVLENYDDEYVLDFIAYFKWKRGERELEKLLQFFNGNNFVINKINNLEVKINNRYTNNYGKISQRK